jgi:hypothetical protein
MSTRRYHCRSCGAALPTADRKDIQQWMVRLSKALIDHPKAVAYEQRMPPSQLLDELVWQALNGRSAPISERREP